MYLDGMLHILEGGNIQHNPEKGTRYLVNFTYVVRMEYTI